MRFYYVGEEDVAPFFVTLKDAKASAKYYAAESYHDVNVELVEIDATKENVQRMANQSGGFMRTLKTVYVAKAKLKREG